MAERNGDDSASVFVRILAEVIKDYPNHSDIIVWSDNWVPQKRNQVISFAVMNFLKTYNNISSTTIHYSIHGHSAVQEMDNMYSNIEKTMSI